MFIERLNVPNIPGLPLNNDEINSCQLLPFAFQVVETLCMIFYEVKYHSSVDLRRVLARQKVKST